MKAIYVLALALFMFSCNEAKDDEGMGDDDATVETTMSINVPQAVKDAFAATYPNATDIEWEMEDGKYEVEFEVEDNEMSVLYNADGTL